MKFIQNIRFISNFLNPVHNWAFLYFLLYKHKMNFNP